MNKQPGWSKELGATKQVLPKTTRKIEKRAGRAKKGK
jgi:hypothetical protein